MSKNKKITLVTALALVLCFGIVGIHAYFTATDTAVNTFLSGEIKLDLLEPSWDTTDDNSNGVPDAAEDVLPNQSLPKDPKIENNGSNDEYVFITVEVPYSTVITANQDGTLANGGSATPTQLFTYTANSGWEAVGSAEWSEADANGDGVVTYVYSYSTSGTMNALGAGESTPTLFDNVTFVNVIGGQHIENTQKNIVVSGYGIQTTNVNGGKTSATDVWTVLSNQIGVGAGSGSDSPVDNAPVITVGYDRILVADKLYAYSSSDVPDNIFDTADVVGDPNYGWDWTITIEGFVSDDKSKIESVTAKWYGISEEELEAEVTGVVSDDGTWSCVFQPFSEEYWKAGTIIITATDDSGNIGTYEIKAEFDMN